MKLQTIGIIILCVFCSTFSFATDFWLEGSKHTNLRVNKDLKTLHPKAFYNVSEQVKGSVVHISTVQILKGVQTPFGFRLDPDMPSDHPFTPFFDRFFGQPHQPKERRSTSLGSGFVLNEDGFIVTNNHVVAKADEIIITFVDETEMRAQIIGRDPKTDLALLKLQGEKKVKPVLLGNSSEMNAGDIVVAIGNPFGLSYSVTQGIISAKERSIGLGPYDDFIQTDASINPGNSGGPLLNLYGEVVGINTAIHASGQGIGFATPIDMAKDVLIRLQEHGQVIRGHLGVRVQAIDKDHVKVLGLKDQQGALVMEVIPNTPASKAAIEPGDVIVSFDGVKIKKWDHLPRVVAQAKIGKKAKVEIIRNKSLKTIFVEIDQLVDEEVQATKVDPKKTEQDPLGLKVIDLDAQARSMLGLSKNQKGVVIVNVDRSSKAFEKGLSRSDVIIELNKKPITDVASYQREVQRIQKGDSVMLMILRENRKIFIAFTLE